MTALQNNADITRRGKKVFDPAQLLAQNQELIAALSNSLGGPCTLAFRDNRGWCSLDTGPADEPAVASVPHRISEMLDQQFHCTNPWVGMHDAKQEFIVPISNAFGLDCAILGEAPCDSNVVGNLLSKTVEAHALKSRLADSEAQQTAFMRQVTADFEELTWLRSLASYIDICDVRHQITDVAAEVLPSLRDLISAELLVLFAQGTVTYKDGNLDLPACTVSELVAQFGAAAMLRPVVRNLGFGNGVGNNSSNVRNVIVMHVGQGEHQFGWLLAINKRPVDPARATQLFHDAQIYSETQFGTFEAGMLASAAVLLGGHAHNLAMFREQKELFQGMVRALINSIDAKDPYTCGHSDRVAQMARRLAHELKLSDAECEQIYMTGLLHDIGKIGVPDAILLKPGKSTAEEFAEIKKHPKIGHSIVEHLAPLRYALPGILHHHESYDGTGYPDKLAGDAIPLFGRILAVADAYDAMTSNRPYRPGMPPNRAEDILRDGAGRQWDAGMVEAFLRSSSAMRDICGFGPNGRAVDQGQAKGQTELNSPSILPLGNASQVPSLETLVPF